MHAKRACLVALMMTLAGVGAAHAQYPSGPASSPALAAADAGADAGSGGCADAAGDRAAPVGLHPGEQSGLLRSRGRRWSDQY